MNEHGYRRSPKEIDMGRAERSIRMAGLISFLALSAAVPAGYFALATLVSGPWLSLIPVGVIFFLVGRVLFLRGYAKGVEGRALGMALTMTPTAFGYLLVLVLMGSRWF